MQVVYQFRRAAASLHVAGLSRHRRRWRVPKDDQGLARSLSRARDALAKRPPGVAPLMEDRSPGQAATALGVLAMALFLAAFKTGQHWLLALAMVVAAAGGLLFVSPHGRARAFRDVAEARNDVRREHLARGDLPSAEAGGRGRSAAGPGRRRVRSAGKGAARLARAGA